MAGTPAPHWHGIPRREIPWFPTVDDGACTGCGLCRKVCGRGVFALVGGFAEVVGPYNCLVGCRTCAAVCPTRAIRFPDREMVRKVEHEHGIYRILQEQSRTRKGRRSALEARTEAEASLARTCISSRIEVAGPFSALDILAPLEALAAEHGVDITDLQLRIPTLHGLQEGTPSLLSFAFASARQGDVRPFVPSLLHWIHRQGLHLVHPSEVQNRPAYAEAVPGTELTGNLDPGS